MYNTKNTLISSQISSCRSCWRRKSIKALRNCSFFKNTLSTRSGKLPTKLSNTSKRFADASKDDTLAATAICVTVMSSSPKATHGIKQNSSMSSVPMAGQDVAISPPMIVSECCDFLQTMSATGDKVAALAVYICAENLLSRNCTAP